LSTFAFGTGALLFAAGLGWIVHDYLENGFNTQTGKLYTGIGNVSSSGGIDFGKYMEK